jgi:hypothetical protein
MSHKVTPQLGAANTFGALAPKFDLIADHTSAKARHCSAIGSALR